MTPMDWGQFWQLLVQVCLFFVLVPILTALPMAFWSYYVIFVNFKKADASADPEEDSK